MSVDEESGAFDRVVPDLDGLFADEIKLVGVGFAVVSHVVSDYL